MPLGCFKVVFDNWSFGVCSFHRKSLVDDRVSSPTFCNSWFKVACQKYSSKFDHLTCGVFELGVRN